MFTKTITSYVCLLGILTLLFTACQEDHDLETATAVPAPAEQADIAVENGLLHFKDQSVWAATIQEMQEAEDYATYVASLGFENSLRAKYDAIEESDELLDDYFKSGKLPKIQDNLFASLLNEDAMVKIGNMLYKVTDDYTFSAADEDGSMLKQFRKKGTSLSKLARVSTFENVDHLAGKTLVVEDGKNKEVARFQGSSEVNWPKPGSSQFRAEVGAWSRTYGLYSSVGVKIETQSYRKGGIFNSNRRWRSRSSNYLYCYGIAQTKECIGGADCTPTFYPSGSNSRSYGKRCERTIAQAGGTGAWHVTEYISGTYRVRYERGESEETFRWRFE